MKNLKYLSSQYILTLKRKKEQIKDKINRIFKKINLNQCTDFIEKTNSFNRKVVDYLNSKFYLEHGILESKDFHFETSSKPWNIHYMDTSKFPLNYGEINKCLRNNLNKEEIEIIGQDMNYFFKDNNIKQHLHIFDLRTLSDKINDEDSKCPLKKSYQCRTTREGSFGIVLDDKEVKESYEKARHYINKNIELDKINEEKEQIKLREKNSIVNKIINKTRFELFKCMNEIKQRKMIFTTLANEQELLKDKTNDTISTNRNIVKKSINFIKKKVGSNLILKNSIGYKQRRNITKRNRKRELDTDNMIKEYSMQIRKNFNTMQFEKLPLLNN